MIPSIMHVMAGGVGGGAENAFVDTILAQQDAGLTVSAVTRPVQARVDRLQAGGVPVKTARFGGMLDVITPFILGRAAKHYDPDIVQLWASRAAQKMPRSKNYRSVARLGGYYPVKYYRGVDWFIANTQDIARYLVDQGVRADRVVTIHNFAHADHAPGRLTRADFNTPTDSFLILFLGRLHPVKGVETLIDAIVQSPDVYVWLAGDGPEREALMARVRARGLGDRIRFIGWQDESARGDLFSLADACVFPSLYEPFGNVMIQAWANRCPLIVSDAQGPRDYARPGHDCLMFPRGDAGELAKHIERLRGDAPLRQALADAGATRCADQFGQTRMIAAYRDFYDRVLRDL